MEAVFTDIKGYYPTKDSFADRAAAKFSKRSYQNFLEPSAGDGQLCKALNRKFGKNSYTVNSRIDVVELDERLQGTLRDKYNLVDTDFLSFNSYKMYDAILMNPPFERGADHLNKAIDIMFNGEIVCMLNAQTIKNPSSPKKKALVARLEELEASIEYVEGAFSDSTRKTDVEVALIHIKIENELENVLFGDSNEKVKEVELEENEETGITTKDVIYTRVCEYNDTLTKGIELIKDFHNSGRFLSKYMKMTVSGSSYNTGYSVDSVSTVMTEQANAFSSEVRHNFWRDLLNIPSVTKRMDSARLEQYHKELQVQSKMEFSEKNIYACLKRIYDGYDESLLKACERIFDKFTAHSFPKTGWKADEYKECLKTIHMFDGWKTNDSYKVGKKVIIPTSDGFFQDSTLYGRKWLSSIERYTEKTLKDIDLVMNSFDVSDEYLSIVDAVNEVIKNDDHNKKKIVSTYFTIDLFKKNTIHLTFNDVELCRRFNVAVGKSKNWLPMDYGATPFKDLSEENKKVVESFEGNNLSLYKKSVSSPLFANKKQSLIGEAV